MNSNILKIVGAVVGAVVALLILMGTRDSAKGTSSGASTPASDVVTPRWAIELGQSVKAIDAGTSGNLGVFVRKLGSNEEMGYRTDRDWYFASTVKVPVAIAVLQLVEEGKLRLDQRIALKKSDFVDGSGEVQHQRLGSKLTLSYLLEKMLTQSDSTATDMLIRQMGVEELNTRIRGAMGVEGFQPFTTILQVRHDAFSKLHPKAKNLTNHHFIALKKFKTSASKTKAIAKQMGVSVQQLQEESVEAAFEKYYRSGLNSGSLRAFGLMLERLAQGKLLSPAHTKLVLRHMASMTTGERRLKAGFPKGTRFAQKTGTQVGRICNVGIATPPAAGSESFIITACVEKFTIMTDAEQTLEKVGRAIAPLLR